VPLFAYISNTLGWRIAFAVCGVIMLALVGAVAVLLDPELSSSESDSSSESSLSSHSSLSSVERNGADLQGTGNKHRGKRDVFAAGEEGDEKEEEDEWGGGQSAWEKARKLCLCRWYLLLGLSFFLCGVVAVGVRGG